MRKAALLIVLIASAVAVVAKQHGSPRAEAGVAAPGTPSDATFVGGATCANCHATQFEQWRGSHHDLAMQEVSEQSVLGNFNDAVFSYNNISSRFYRDGERFMVRTDGADGTLQDFPVKYTFGVDPLQQYLIEFPGGRLQALSIAWDSRPAAAGGQRWFHLYPGEKVDYKDELHWTGRNQNWNFMCADCHSTNLQKNYDAGSARYATRWSEINVSCEACHGPGSEHNKWAAKDASAQALDATQGLTIRLDERKGVSWPMNPATGIATRSTAHGDRTELEMCAGCHSRRSVIASGKMPGHAFMNAFRPALLTEQLYHADGQIKDEVYVYGSFIQSKMFRAGVTCSDCHEPHSLALRASGDGLCLTCHAADKFATAKHHFHNPASAGARCVECHMPATNYMIVDPRRDHSIRVPRPDLSQRLGTPNACIACHTKQTNDWAAERVRAWYKKPAGGYQNFAEALHAGRSGAPDAPARLLDLIVSEEQPAIARATALSLLARYPTPQAMQMISNALYDDDPIVRLGGLEALEAFQPNVRFAIGQHLLDDKVLAVRIEAGRVLAGSPANALDAAQQAKLNKSIDAYITAQRVNADQPQIHINLGNLYVTMRNAGEAERAYRRAFTLDPQFVPAYVNLADLFRMLQREQAALDTLEQGLAVAPDNATLHHVYGLALVRGKQLARALKALARAVELQPDNTRYGYIYAVALDANGELGKAMEVLARYHARDANNMGILAALASYTRKAGNATMADQYDRQLKKLQRLRASGP